MLVEGLTFMLMIIIEGCAGPLPAGKGCSAENFNIRVPYDTLEKCEDAKKRLIAPGGIQQYIRPICLAIPKPPAR